MALCVLGGCSDEDPCEAAGRKLDSCKSQLQTAAMRDGFVPLPLTFDGQCTEDDERCLAECVNAASCSDIADFGVITDPNAPPLSQGFDGCARKYLRAATQDPAPASTPPR